MSDGHPGLPSGEVMPFNGYGWVVPSKPSDRTLIGVKLSPAGIEFLDEYAAGEDLWRTKPDGSMAPNRSEAIRRLLGIAAVEVRKARAAKR